MSLWEAFKLAIGSLTINRLRAMLTTLGIVIGVGSVISLISLGRGVEDFIAAEFQDLGTNLLTVISTRPNSATRTRVDPITTIEAAALSDPSIAPSIEQIALDFRTAGVVEGGGSSYSTVIAGVTPNMQSVRTWLVRDGDYISQRDMDEEARVAVLGVNAVEELYGDKLYNPIGETIRINQRVFTVIGVMTELGSTFLSDDDYVFVPLTTAQSRLTRARTRDGGYRVSAMWVQATSKDTMTAGMREIDAYLTEAHNIVFDGDQDFVIINQADLISSIGQITGLLTVVLGLIAGISLLVGGIGIMNIMLVSVTERTREIGLRKAVGARGSDILVQFLIESVVLSVVGGLMGVGIGLLVVIIGSSLAEQSGSTLRLSLTTDAILLATGVSSFVGIFFGLYPASRAARLRPIQALRYE